MADSLRECLYRIDVHERHKQVKARVQRGVVPAQALHDEGALLWHHERRAIHNEEHQCGNQQENDQRTFHQGPRSARISSSRSRTATTRQRSPDARSRVSTLRTLHVVPRSSARPC